MSKFEQIKQLLTKKAKEMQLKELGQELDRQTGVEEKKRLQEEIQKLKDKIAISEELKDQKFVVLINETIDGYFGKGEEKSVERESTRNRFFGKLSNTPAEDVVVGLIEKLYGKNRLLSEDIFKGVYQYFNAEDNSVVTVTLIAPAQAIEVERIKREKEQETAAKQYKLLDEGGVIITDKSTGRLIEIRVGDKQKGVDVLGDFLGRIKNMVAADEINAAQMQKIMRDRWVFTIPKTSSQAVDINGQKQDQDITVTLVFPYHSEYVREETNLRTGESELRIFNYGLLDRVITRDKITVMKYNDLDVEISSDVYVNETGEIIKDAKEGSYLQKTETVAFDTKDVDPVSKAVSPVVIKKVTDPASHAVKYEVYKDYELPVMTFSEKYVTIIEFDEWGREKTSRTYVNTGSLDKPRWGKQPVLSSEVLPLVGELDVKGRPATWDKNSKWSSKLVIDHERNKHFVEVRDQYGRLIKKYDGKMEEKPGAEQNKLQVIPYGANQPFEIDARDPQGRRFVVEKETSFYHKYEERFAALGVDASVMNLLGLQGTAMVGETYLYEFNPKTGQGKRVSEDPVGRSVAQVQRPQKTGIEKYFDDQGNVLLQMSAPRQKLVWQQVIDNQGRKVTDYYGYLVDAQGRRVTDISKYKGDIDKLRFVREKVSYSIYTIGQLNVLRKQYPKLYDELKTELKNLNVDIESEQFLKDLISQGKIDVALMGVTFSYDDKTKAPIELAAFSTVQKNEKNKYISDGGEVLVISKDTQKKEATQQIIDSEGRIKLKYNGRFDSKAKRFIREKITKFFYTYEDRFAGEYFINPEFARDMKILGLYGVAMVGETFTYDDTTGRQSKEPIAYSFLRTFKDGNYVDNEGNILVQMTNANQHMSRQDVINNQGHTIIRYLGKLIDPETKEFEKAQSSRFFYSTQQLEEFSQNEKTKGLYTQLIKEYAALGWDIESPAFKADLNRYGKFGVALIGATYIYDQENDKEVALMSVSRIKKNEQGAHIDAQGNVLVEMKNIINNLHWQELIDNSGRIQVKYDGVVIDGQFIRNQKTYYFYDYASYDAYRKAHPELKAELDAWEEN